jgi:hypothetical protein
MIVNFWRRRPTPSSSSGGVHGNYHAPVLLSMDIRAGEQVKLLRLNAKPREEQSQTNAKKEWGHVNLMVSDSR